MESLRLKAYECFLISEAVAKADESKSCYQKLCQAQVYINPLESIDMDGLEPGIPDKPDLVDPKQVSQRSMASVEGRLALIHAIAHIEFNAINLAWDAVCRFNGMPDDYYRDWARIASEEAEHFSLLNEYLCENNCAYGDFNAHAGLWHMAKRTSHDVLIRMALVPRVLEARGLDVTPVMIKKFRQQGDDRIVQILERIYEDEIGHVDIGSKWFRYLCEQRGELAENLFQKLVNEFFSDGLRGPFNLQAREAAGFTKSEIEWLNRI